MPKFSSAHVYNQDVFRIEISYQMAEGLNPWAQVSNCPTFAVL
jgi:hypothetical protein